MVKNTFSYSIIIPHYNIPDLLARCLRTIPERDDVQVIVVDDQSKDSENYLETIPELHRKNVEFFIVDEKKYAGHARNVGLSHASGKWLLFADPDDFYVDGFMNITDKYLNENVDIIYFNTVSCDCYKTDCILQSCTQPRFDKYEKSGDDLRFRLSFTEPWAKMVRRDFVMKHQLMFQETIAHNDLLFGVKIAVLAKRTKIVNTPIYWYVYRLGSTGHSVGNESYEKVCARVSAWHETHKFLESAGFKLKSYLPLEPCIILFRRDQLTYFKILKYIRSNNMRYILTFLLTLKQAIFFMFGQKRSGFEEKVIPPAK